MSDDERPAKEPIIQRGGLIRLAAAVVSFGVMYALFHYLSAHLH